MLRVAVVGDTHVPGRARDLPPSAWARIARCDRLVHAGDVVGADFLDHLAARIPVDAVRGNNDVTLDGLPDEAVLDLDGVRVAVIHDSGPPDGRRDRLARRFPMARVAIFGHSHVPVLDDESGLLLLNPGSPTDRRRMPTFTMAELTLDAGEVAGARIVDLGLDRA